MTNQWTKRSLLSVVLISAALLGGCGEDEPEINPLQVQYEENVAKAPDRSEPVMEMITESRGQPELDPNGNETGVIIGSYSKGADREIELSVMSRDQLKELDKLSQIDIYLNGILRDEFHVAAHVLYGSEQVEKQQNAFKEALLTPEEGEGRGRIVDNIVMETMMEDPDVAHHFVDDVITHLNRLYINPVIAEDFEDKVVISGDTYPLTIIETFNALEHNAPEFIELDSLSRYDRTESDINKLNAHYKESFVTALEKSVTKNSGSSDILGGFIENEEGLWVPSDMNRLAKSLIYLAYLK